MFDRPSLRLSEIARMGLIATSLVGSLAFGSASIALAQDATPEASPMVECVPGEISTEVIDMASPEAMEASPVAEEAPVGTPADDATTTAATDAVNNIVACAADPANFPTVVTTSVVAIFGYASIADAQADGLFEEAPFGQDVTVGDAVTYEDGSIGVDIQYMGSQYQVTGEEWNLVDEGGTWKLNGFTPTTVQVDGDTAAVGVSLGENEDGTYFITPNASSVVETDVIILQATNNGVEPHEMIVLQVPEGVDPMGLLDGSVSEEDVTFIGHVGVDAPGSMAEMTLVGLPVGQYTLICFYPSADGAPHAAHGMIAPFEVTAPAE